MAQQHWTMLLRAFQLRMERSLETLYTCNMVGGPELRTALVGWLCEHMTKQGQVAARFVGSQLYRTRSIVLAWMHEARTRLE